MKKNLSLLAILILFLTSCQKERVELNSIDNSLAIKVNSWLKNKYDLESPKNKTEREIAKKIRLSQ